MALRRRHGGGAVAGLRIPEATSEARRFPRWGGGLRGRRVRPDTRAGPQGGGVLDVRRTTGGTSTWRDGPSSREGERGGATAAAGEDAASHLHDERQDHRAPIE